MQHHRRTRKHGLSPVRQRDVRVDFFRGLALIFIFVDHIQENVLQYVTMQNFGFADAADVFVALAGYASFLAYTKVFDREGWPAGLFKVGRRISTLYIAHILLLIVCVAALALAALLADNVVYQDVVNLEPFFDEPGRALRKALVLSHQPDMLDILPLYVVLLLWFPLLLLLMRIHLVLALSASVALWIGANIFNWNLPSYPDNAGWYFNPFAWQLLFTLGAIAAHSAASRPCRGVPPRSFWWHSAWSCLRWRSRPRGRRCPDLMRQDYCRRATICSANKTSNSCRCGKSLTLQP